MDQNSVTPRDVDMVDPQSHHLPPTPRSMRLNALDTSPSHHSNARSVPSPPKRPPTPARRRPVQHPSSEGTSRTPATTLVDQIANPIKQLSPSRTTYFYPRERTPIKDEDDTDEENQQTLSEGYAQMPPSTPSTSATNSKGKGKAKAKAKRAPSSTSARTRHADPEKSPNPKRKRSMYEDDDYELQASSSDDMGGLSAGDDDIEIVVSSSFRAVLSCA